MTVDTTKTDMVEPTMLNGETATEVKVVLNRHDKGITGESWLINVAYGWAETIVADCDYPHHAAGVAYALAGVLDCDLDLGEDLEQRLAQTREEDDRG